MDWNMVADFIDAKFGVIIACCWVLGYIFKKTPFVPDWLIIYLVTAGAIVLVICLDGLNVEAVIQGMLCGAVAVYGHQLLKQTKKGSEEHESV